MLPLVVTGNSGVTTSAVARPTGAATRESAGRPVSRTDSMATATSSTIAKLTPETPIQLNKGAKGLSDCESATRPHANPPYGHTLAHASRAVHRPATTTGSRPRRPATPGNATGSHR